MNKPNIVYVFADQWRAESFGYTGNPDVKTPNIDAFSQQACDFSNAISNCPVCSPYRASLLTGQRPLKHGVFINDVPLNPDLTGFGSIFKDAGYQTGYIGKWHIDGYGRENFIPNERRLGFDYWKVCECSHDYMMSPYFEGDNPEKKYWEGYDASAQTDDAILFMENYHSKKASQENSDPFLLFLSWGPPHGPPPYALDSPYDQYPPELDDLYESETLQLRLNVPEESKERTRALLKGYYTHCTALDHCFGRLVNYLNESGLSENTIIVFTSDHGDMLGSQGIWKKQSPFDESIRIPLMIHLPDSYKIQPGKFHEAIIGPHDILPTLLGLANITSNINLDGFDYSRYLRGEEELSEDAELIALYQPAGQWRRNLDGGPLGFSGREYRGIRTQRYTYVRDLSGPWLFFDNKQDPFQLHNLINVQGQDEIINYLDSKLSNMLSEAGDEFLPGKKLIEKYGYTKAFAQKINPSAKNLCLENWGYESAL